MVSEDTYKIGDTCSACPLVAAPLCLDSLCVPSPEDAQEVNHAQQARFTKNFFCASGSPPQPSLENPNAPQRCFNHHVFGSGDCKRGYSCQASPFYEHLDICCPVQYTEIMTSPVYCPNSERPEFFDGGEFAKLCRLGESIVSSCSPGFICTKSYMAKESQRFYCCPPNAGLVREEVRYCAKVGDEPENDKRTNRPKVCNPAFWNTCSRGFECSAVKRHHGRFFCCPVE